MKLLGALFELMTAILQMLLLLCILIIMALGFVVAFPFFILVGILSVKSKKDDGEFGA